MFYVLQNESTASLRRIPILLTDAATGTTAMAGVNTASIYPYVAINGGAFIGGTGPVYESGFGQYVYQMHPAETATLGLAGIHITAPACRDYDAIAQIAAFNVYSASVGATAGDIWNYDISAISTAGLAGKQLNDAAAGGGITAGDVWDYNGTTNPATVKETLELAKQYADTAQGQTGPTSIRDAVWDTDVSFVTAPNAGYQLYQAALGTTSNAPDQVWSYVTREITGGTATTVTNPVLVDPVSMTGIAGTVWSTDISAYTAPSAGYDLANASAGGGISAYDVWSFDYSAYPIVPVSAAERLEETRTEAYAASNNTVDLANKVWGNDLASGAFSPYAAGTAGTILYELSLGGGGITAGAVADAVWNSLTSSYTTSGTFGLNTLRSDVAGVAGTVSLWTGGAYSGIYADTYRIDTSYVAATALKDILTGIGASITGNITGDLSGSVGSVTADVNVSTASMAGVANTVWSTLTAPYTVHGTYGHQVLRSDNAATIGEVTLHQSGGSKRVDADVHAFVNNTASATAMLNILTGIGASITSNITGSLSGSVGSVTSPVSVATASMTGIAGTVWSVATRTITGGTITTVSDKTGYSLSDTQSFNLTGNITGSLSGSVGSVSGAVGSVTGSVGSVTGSVGSVVSAVTLSSGTQSSIANSVWLTNISGYGAGSAGNALLNAGGGGVAVTAGDIWTYNTRTLTAGGGITAGDVWTYNISAITNSGTAGKQLNDASVSGSVVTIVNGPYTLNSTAEGTDGRIDILQDSVQTIELMLVNAFGSPINISGNYTVSVDIYDEASALVHSYSPTINYALGGILSFDLDTLVTANIGRYSIVVSLTDGDVIQVGPLQILVRPL